MQEMNRVEAILYLKKKLLGIGVEIRPLGAVTRRRFIVSEQIQLLLRLLLLRLRLRLLELRLLWLLLRPQRAGGARLKRRGLGREQRLLLLGLRSGEGE